MNLLNQELRPFFTNRVSIQGFSKLYREFRPCRALQPYILCFWSSTSFGKRLPLYETRVLCDGCADILFGCRRGSTDFNGIFAGTMTRPGVPRSEGVIDTFAVRFRPGGAFPFLRSPLHEITNSSAPWDVFFGAEALEVEERLAETANTEGRIQILEEFLLRRLFRREEFGLELLQNGIRRIVSQNGQIRVSELARDLGYCERHMNRLFRQFTGISPKMFCRITRFICTLDSIAKKSHRNGAWLAAEKGYFDQPHMIREFEEFSGLSPREFAKGREKGFGSCPINTIPSPTELLPS